MDPKQQSTDEIVKTTEDLLARSRQLLDDLDDTLNDEGGGSLRPA